jgi:phosphate acetyltransferase
MLNPVYFGTMMVKLGLADGMVAGATTTTQETFRPALQIVKAKIGQDIVSSFFIMESPIKSLGSDGVFIFADCGLNINPDQQQLAQIAIQSAESFKQLVGDTPKIAMLSYSTVGSGSGESVDKVQQATQIIKQLKPDLIIEGETQLDAAIIPEIALKKNPNSLIQGQANILIFPNLDAGNIGYKLVERFGQAHAFGPITQGLAKPINDLSRGCNAEDIVTTIAITSVQS